MDSHISNLTAPIVVKKKKTWVNVLISIFSVLLIVLTVIGTALFFFVYIPIQRFYRQAQTIQTDIAGIKTAISNKDLKDLKNQLATTKTKVSSLETSYKQFGYFGVLPVAKDYYHDGQAMFKMADSSFEAADIVIQSVEPYQDFLGLKGSSPDAAKTTEDRINFLTESIESLVPHLDTLDQKVADIQSSLDQIDPNRYPDEFKGYQIKSNILKAKELVAQANTLIKNGKPILSKTSWMLGKDAPRNYLLLFQNDAELRPTGGFWTAFALIQVNKGKISPQGSDDIYTLDAKINSTVPAPRPIKAYHINVPYYNVRDMNISPDYTVSAPLFLQNYQKAYGSKTKIDAVIAIDTRVLVDIVNVIGRVGVSGFGNFDATPDKRCDGCPQIIYQLELISDKPKSFIDANRKGFLAPLMNSLLANAMGAEKSKIGPLVEAAFNDIFQKHILFYFTNNEMQQAAELANIAGQITPTDANTDYMNITEANMASAKTNLFLTQKIKHEIRVNNGVVEHKITLTTTNPSRASNCNLEAGQLCLNAPTYRDWFRFYVPTGSTLEKMTGSEVDPVKYEESGKQVFEGFYGNKYPLYAQSSNRVSVQYQSSVKPSSDYTLYLQKQAGTKPIDYELWVNGVKIDTFSWTADKTIKLSL